MDDDRLTARLRALDGLGASAQPRAEFVDDLHARLAGQLGFPGEGIAKPGPGQGQIRRGRPWLLIAAAIALLIGLIANLATIGAVVERILERPSLYESMDSTESVRVAIRPDVPQVRAPNGALSGFDIDVAESIGGRLGYRIDRVIQPVDEMLGDDPTWHLAFPSRALTEDEAARHLSSAPYYWWPTYVVALTPGPSDLAGATVCVVADSPGASWATGRPEIAQVTSGPDDATCLAAVRAGDVDAMVSSLLLPVDITGDPDLVIVGGRPVAHEPRGILVPRRASDADAVVDAIDAALDGLRAEGILAQDSARRFGGEDLTTEP